MRGWSLSIALGEGGGGGGGEGKGWRILGRSQGFQGKLRGEQPSQSLPMGGIISSEEYYRAQ